jgi:phosphohistidine phosphatase
MQVVIIRHGIAVELDESAKAKMADAERPLTKPGTKKMRAAAKGLARVVDGGIDVLAASPLVRAQQTAAIVAEAFEGETKVATVDELKPGKPAKAVLQWLQGQKADATIAVVGHEPQLGMLISYLLAGDRKRSFVEVRKGSATLLEFPEQVKAGGAMLQWMLKPSQLRDLGKGD